jgi:hypothetical protein
MKSVLAIFSILTLTSVVALGGDPASKEVVIGISDAFVPGGFDSDTDAYVVVSGMFPNSCYRWKKADIAHVDTFEHEITSIAQVSQGMCLMVLVPFTRDIQLGRLDTGKHILRFKGGDGTFLEKTLIVE